MIDVSILGTTRQKLKNNETSDYAIVVDVKNGVKLKVYGEQEPRPMYYNSLVVVAPGDKVHIKKIGEEMLVMGKLQY